jgi:hypothetical protein
LTTTNDLSDSDRLTGMYLYQTIELYDTNRTLIAFCSPDTLYGEIETLPFEKKRIIENALLDDVPFNNTTCTTLTPIFSFFNERLNNSIPAYMNSKLFLEITTNVNASSMGFSADISDCFPELIAEYHWFPLSVYKEQPPITYMSFEYYIEKPITLSATTEFSFPLNCNKLVSNAFIFIKDANNVYLPIKEVILYKNNTEYAYKINRDWNSYIDDVHHDSLGTMILLDLGYGNNDVENIGSLDMNTKNFYNISVKTYTNASTSYSLYVVFKYRNVLDFKKKVLGDGFEFLRYDLN